MNNPIKNRKKRSIAGLVPAASSTGQQNVLSQSPMIANAVGAAKDMDMFLEIDNYSADCYMALNEPVNFPVVNVVLVAVRKGTDDSQKETRCDSSMMKLLAAIQECGNVRVACKKNGISYSRAWKLLGLLEEWAGRKMIDRHQGGLNGGRTELSKEGIEFFEKYKQFEVCCKAAIKNIYDDFFQDGTAYFK